MGQHDEHYFSWRSRGKIVANTNSASALRIPRLDKWSVFQWYFSSMKIEIGGLWNIFLHSKICRKVKIRSIQSRPGWKLTWFSRMHLHSFTCKPKWKVHYGCGPAQLFYKVFCLTFQSTVLRVNLCSIGLYSRLAYARLPWTSINSIFRAFASPCKLFHSVVQRIRLSELGLVCFPFCKRPTWDLQCHIWNAKLQSGKIKQAVQLEHFFVSKLWTDYF